MKVKSTFAAVLLLAALVATPCSFQYIRGTQLLPTDRVFKGTIVGYVDETEVDAPGVLVKVQSAVVGPGPEELVAVVPFSLGTDCVDYPPSLNDLEERYRIGMAVWVIAQARHSDDETATRLFTVSQMEGQHILELYDYLEQSQEPFDYLFHERSIAERFPDRQFNYERAVASLYRQYELMHDLLRLSETPDEDTRVKILKRLIPIPRMERYGPKWFERLVDEYVDARLTKRRLLREFRNDYSSP